MDLSQFDGNVNNTNKEVAVSQGDVSAIQADGDVIVAFWNDTKAAFVDAAVADSEGIEITCMHSRMRLTTTGSVNIRVIRVPRR